MLASQDALSLFTDLVHHYWLILGFGIASWLLSNRYLTPLRKLPGPFFASCTRIPRFLAVLRGRPHEWELKLHEKYGNIVRTGPDLVSVGDPAAISLIYAASDKFKKVSAETAPESFVLFSWVHYLMVHCSHRFTYHSRCTTKRACFQIRWF